MNLKNKLAISTFIVAVTLSVAIPVEAGWRTYTPSDGLASVSVYEVVIDRSGDFWIGTRAGLTRYDGVNWVTYTTLDGLADDRVYAILEDSAGTLWFGTNGGVSRFDGRHWTTFTESDGLARDKVTSIAQDSTGALWFATFGGASRYDGESWRTYTTADGLVSDQVSSVMSDSSGDMWFTCFSYGVSRFDGATWTTYTEADGLPNKSVQEIFEDSSGNVWFGTSGGAVTRFDGLNWTTFTTDDGLGGYSVTAIFEDGAGAMWFGTYNGVSRLDGAGWSSYTRDDGLADNFVEAITEDGSGNMWFGTVYGLSRYDRVSWKIYTTEDGLADNAVYSILQDREGDMWFATWSGISRYDGSNWTNYFRGGRWTSGMEDSAGNLWFSGYNGWVILYDGEAWTGMGSFRSPASAIMEDSTGNVWVATGEGAARFDGETWRVFTTEDGLAGNIIQAVFEDIAGNLWFGTFRHGVSVFDGVTWGTYTSEDGLAGDDVYAITQDSSGEMWFGTDGGASRFDGSNWTTLTTENGLLDNYVRSILEDRMGVLWFANLGVTRYDGETWASYTQEDGLTRGGTAAICEDSSGSLWFGSAYGFGGGAIVHEPDRGAPETVIWPVPAPVTASATQTIVFVAAYGETEGVKFSHSLDGAPWSEWSTVNSWTGNDIGDGEHTFQVVARDRVGNEDESPAKVTFTVDATAPAPLILSPYSGEAVGKTVAIEGTADDLRFERFDVEVRPAGAAEWGYLGGGSRAVTDGALASWNTTTHPDGDYEIRLSVSDTLGLTGTALVRVIVDNEAPWAYETTPVLISSENGGDVYTTGREAHLYFPPNAFTTDTEVRIGKLTEEDVPDTLPGGKRRRLPGFAITWNDTAFSKPGTLELTLERLEFDRNEGPGAYPDKSSLSIYVLGADSTWRMLGGTLDRDGDYLSAPATEPGLYAVFDAGALPSGGVALSPLRITPRVFSPVGSFANTMAAIGFNLGRPGPVTVKIYNRAGRLVSQIISGEQLNAGANLVHWDGRDRDGGLVEDGVYLVAVEALGKKQVKPLAVVR